MRRRASLGLSVALAACSSASARSSAKAPGPAEGPVRVRAVKTHADAWLGRDLQMDVYEEVHFVPTGEAPRYLIDLGGRRFGQSLIVVIDPSASNAGTSSLDLQPPVRLQGALRRPTDPELQSLGVDVEFVLDRATPIELPTPTVLRSPATVWRRRRRWHAQAVQVTGVWTTGFEISMLGRIWVEPSMEVVVRCEPPPEPRRHLARRHSRVRLVGLVYTARRYGHLGIGKAKLIATEVTFLDTPGCEP